jgi:hypothetical protein
LEICLEESVKEEENVQRWGEILIETPKKTLNSSGFSITFRWFLRLATNCGASMIIGGLLLLLLLLPVTKRIGSRRNGASYNLEEGAHLFGCCVCVLMNDSD